MRRRRQTYVAPTPPPASRAQIAALLVVATVLSATIDLFVFLALGLLP